MHVHGKCRITNRIILLTIIIFPCVVGYAQSQSLSGGVHYPQCTLSVDTHISNTQIHRGDIIELKYELHYKYGGEKELPIEISDKLLLNSYEIVGFSHPDNMANDRANDNLYITVSLSPKESCEYIYYIKILNSSETGYVKVISPRYVKASCNDPKIRLVRETPLLPTYVTILNDELKIKSANVTILSDPPLPLMNGSLIYKYISQFEPITVRFNTIVLYNDS